MLLRVVLHNELPIERVPWYLHQLQMHSPQQLIRCQIVTWLVRYCIPISSEQIPIVLQIAVLRRPNLHLFERHPLSFWSTLIPFSFLAPIYNCMWSQAIMSFEIYDLGEHLWESRIFKHCIDHWKIGIEMAIFRNLDINIIFVKSDWESVTVRSSSNFTIHTRLPCINYELPNFSAYTLLKPWFGQVGSNVIQQMSQFRLRPAG